MESIPEVEINTVSLSNLDNAFSLIILCEIINNNSDNVQRSPHPNAIWKPSSQQNEYKKFKAA